MAKDGKISQVKTLLQAAPHTYKDLMSKTGITKATAYSLDYYLGKQGYGIVKGQNDAKEVTLHIVSVPKTVAPKEAVAEQVVHTVPVAETPVHKVAVPRKSVTKALAGNKAAKKAK